MRAQTLTGYPSVDKPWLKYYSETAIYSKTPECTMYEYVCKNNKEYLRSNALTYLGQKITYRKLLSAIDQTAAAFSALGVQRGDIVTIQSLTIPQVIFSIYALSKIGAIANLIYANMDGPAVCASIAETNSHILVVMEPIFNIIKGDFADANLKAIIVMRIQDEMDFITKALYSISSKTIKAMSESCIIPWRTFFNMGRGKETSIIGQGSDPAIMVYTGGTTGKSKAVVLSNNNVNAAALQYLHLGFERGKTMLCSLPPFIAFGIVVTLHTPLAFGLNTALCVTRDLSEIGGFVQKYRPNYIICGTAQAEKLMASLQHKKIDLSFLRCLSLGGDMLPEKTENMLNEFLISHNAKIQIAQGYAMTETAATAVGSTRTIGTTVYKKGTVGVPLVHTNIKIVDPENEEMLKYNQSGEICVSGPCTMMEYFKDEEETHRILKIHDDGIVWVHTGDIGSMDEDGFITITGRIKRIILTSENGIFHKVFPKLLEDKFETCDCIDSLAIVGRERSNDTLSHDLVAFVVLKNNISQVYALPTLTAYAEKHFEHYERPCKYIFIENLPRTQIGKIDFKALEKLAAE